MPRGFSERDKASIHANLIDAGRARLATTGMHKTSVDELARAAHISKGAFYRFFPSKEALFITLFTEAEREYRDKLREFAARPGKTPQARLLAFFRDALGSYRHTPSLSRVSREDMNALVRALTPAARRAAAPDEEAFVRELFAIWRKSGLKVACKPAEFSALMQSIFVLDLYAQDMGEAHRATVDLLLEALAARLAKPLATRHGG